MLSAGTVANSFGMTIEQALDALMSREVIEGLKKKHSGAEIRASQQHTLDQLPRVLVCHLKRFDYTDKGSVKLTKEISYPSELALSTRFLFGPAQSLAVAAAAKEKEREKREAKDAQNPLAQHTCIVVRGRNRTAAPPLNFNCPHIPCETLVFLATVEDNQITQTPC